MFPNILGLSRGSKQRGGIEGLGWDWGWSEEEREDMKGWK